MNTTNTHDNLTAELVNSLILLDLIHGTTFTEGLTPESPAKDISDALIAHGRWIRDHRDGSMNV